MVEKESTSRSANISTLKLFGMRKEIAVRNDLFCCLLTIFVVISCARQLQAEQHVPVKTALGLTYAEVKGQKLQLDLYLPEKVQSPPLLVWIHGGGWRGGSRKAPKLGEMVQHGFAVASISYRLTDKALFPAQIHDCKAAIRWLRAHAQEYGYNAKSIAVAGSSAGGHLALLMGTSGGVENLEGTIGNHLEQSSRVQAVIDYYGPSDFVLRGKTQPERAYTTKSGSYALLGGKDGKVAPTMERLASPAIYVSTDDPPLLIFHGTNDRTVLLDQSERIHNLYTMKDLDAKLVVLDGAGHGGKSFYQGEHFNTALQFLKKHLALETLPSAGTR